MAERARHAFGSSQNIEAAVQAGKIDAFDILFLDGDTDPKVGWLDKNGNPVIMESTTELKGQVSELETQISNKANAEQVAELETVLATKVSAEDVEDAIANKADIAEVDEKIGQAVTDTVATAKSYIDGKVEAALNEHMIKKYEISNKPEGTLVDYGDKEIRVLCPADTKWEKQTVGGTGNANMYYMGFRAYAPEGAVGFKEGDRGVIIDEYFDFNGDFAGTDEFGRNYSICWLALAMYDESKDTWTYFGKNSSVQKYIGWDYVVEWYDANGVIIESDCVRINLSNEDCHYVTMPYYMGVMEKKVEDKITEIETKIEKSESAYEVIEF